MTYVQRCVKCNQPWNGWAGSACNQCKILEEQQRASERLAKQIEEDARRARQAERDAEFAEIRRERMARGFVYDDTPSETQIVYVPEENKFTTFLLLTAVILVFVAIIMLIPYLYMGVLHLW